MRSPVMFAVGLVVLLLGLLFMFQGLGVIGGSGMSNSNTWALTGPVIAVAGAVLAAVGLRRRPPPTPRDEGPTGGR
jgi:hypothetical protein